MEKYSCKAHEERDLASPPSESLGQDQQSRANLYEFVSEDAPVG